ncbi:MAG TPA: Cof-type HAD-IIB family hydrolase [Candidatus Tyrphobacter sp.]
MIRFVAYDLDGTLVGRDLVLHPRVRQSIARVRAAGVNGCIVTGRMYRASLPYARELELDAPLVCYQGAAIVDPQSDDVLFDMPLSNAIALEVVEMARRDGIHVQLYRSDLYYCEQRNRFSDLYTSLSLAEPVIVPSLRELFATSDATKAVVIADADVAERYAARIQERLGKRAYVTRSYPEFVEILNPFVNKGEALEFVAARLEIPMENVLAIGDSWNDAPLLHVAGVGVAMGNAPEDVRALADAVVADVEHDGVAEALDRYIPT